MKKVAIGSNSYKLHWNGSNYTTHAEMDALKKLKKKHSTIKRRTNVNILVVRLNKSGQLCSSKPCSKCVKHMSRMGYYRIKNVYYSSEKGDIVKTTLSELI